MSSKTSKEEFQKIYSKVIGIITKDSIDGKVINLPLDIIDTKFLHRIFSIQAKAIKRGIITEETVKVDQWGKFMIKPGRVEVWEYEQELIEEGLSEDERKKKCKEFVGDFYRTRKIEKDFKRDNHEDI